MKTYSQFIAENEGKVFWADSLGDGEYLDILAYDSQADSDADIDNSLAVERATVLDDRNI